MSFDPGNSDSRVRGIVTYTIAYEDGSELTLRLEAEGDSRDRLGSASGTLEVPGARMPVEVTYAYPPDDAPVAIVGGVPPDVMAEVWKCALHFCKTWEERR